MATITYINPEEVAQKLGVELDPGTSLTKQFSFLENYIRNNLTEVSSALLYLAQNHPRSESQVTTDDLVTLLADVMQDWKYWTDPKLLDILRRAE